MKILFIPVLLLSLLVVGMQNCFANGRLSGVDEEIKEGVIKVNELMVDKDRERSLAAINEVAGQLRGIEVEPELSVYQNLERLEFYLSKYEWIKARRILKGLMDDMGLSYKPTYD
ncbi:MAG: hypothetical protein WBB19_12280 [Desulforhopalus sp.]